jgi:hypothetical protein
MMKPVGLKLRLMSGVEVLARVRASTGEMRFCQSRVIISALLVGATGKVASSTSRLWVKYSEKTA